MTNLLFKYILALFFCISLQAQEMINLEGKILNDTVGQSSLNVVNVSLKKGAITNADGEFVIPARVQDTIYIRAVQYEPRYFVVSETIFNRKKVSFYLVPKITELEEVLLNNSLLTGRLDRDATNELLLEDLEAIKKADAIGLLPDLPRKTIEERRLYTATTGTKEIDINFVSLFNVPISRIINGISGKTKKLKKQKSIANNQKRLSAIRSNFSTDFYTNTLSIPVESIDEFISYLIQDHNLLEVNTEDKLLLLEFIQDRAPQYLKAMGLQEIEIKND